MLKHVQVSPHRNRADSVSLRSSTSCASSLCGSPEPPIDSMRPSSRASSYCSLSETAPQVSQNTLAAHINLSDKSKFVRLFCRESNLLWFLVWCETAWFPSNCNRHHFSILRPMTVYPYTSILLLKHIHASLPRMLTQLNYFQTLQTFCARVGDVCKTIRMVMSGRWKSSLNMT